MLKTNVLSFISRMLWAVYWRIAIRIGKRDAKYPDIAWTNTRPRMTKISNWILDLHK